MSNTTRSAPSSDFRATLPVKPSVTITSTLPSRRSRPSTLPTKSTPTPAASSACASLASWLPFVDSSPIDKKRHLRGGGAVAAGDEDRSHLGELDQPLGLAIGVGAGVDEDRRAPADRRDERGDGRAGDAGQPPHPQQRARHRGAGVAGAHHRAGPPVAHRLGRPARGSSPSSSGRSGRGPRPWR